MKILESWEDNEGRAYAVVRHSDRDQARYKLNQFEAMFEFDGELHNFGGWPGSSLADFATVEEAEKFLLTGIARQDENPDVWLDMVQLTSSGRGRLGVDRSRC